MDDAKEQLARFRGSMQPRLTSLQGRLQTVPGLLQTAPDRLVQNLPDQIREKIPDTITKNLPRHARTGSASSNTSSSSPRSPSPASPRTLLARAAALPTMRSPTTSPPIQQQLQQQLQQLPQQPQLRAPSPEDPNYNHELAALAARILYRSGTDPVTGGPLLVLCAGAFPDANIVDYTVLLPYVLSNLPSDEELAPVEDGGQGGGYSVIFFASGGDKKQDTATRPSWKWTLQAYTLVGVIREMAGRMSEDREMEMADENGQLGRAVRKNIRKLWIVHEKSWIRTIFEIFSNVVSVKFKKKVMHLNTLSELALQLDITKLDIPPAVYIYDRKFEPEIILPGFPPSPVFGRPPFNNFANPPRVGDATPLPQVLVEASTYIRRSCLGQEGLFRIPPSNVILEAARDCYDRRTSLRWEDWGVHTAAGLIKLYYRLLPEPMIPASCYEQMQSLVVTDPSRRPSPETEVQARFEVVRALLTAEVSGLPLFSRILFLRHLLPLLSEVAAHSEQNKMTPVNLAVCVSGSLARSDNLEADARALGGIRIFLEIALKHIDDLAPKLPLRRGAGGMPTAEKRRSQASISSLDDAPSTSNSGSSSRSSIPRKQVPSIALPLWEPQDKEPAILRRVPAPQREALVEIPMQISQPEKSEGRRLGAPMGPRPQPPRTRSRGRPEHEETAAAPTPSPRFTPNSSTETLPLLPRDHTPLHHPHNPTTGPLSHPYNPPTVPPKIALRPVSSYSSLRGPTKLPATTVLSVAGTGTFARPALRRVVSTNSLGPAIVQRRASFELESTGETELAAPQGLRRARSQLIQRSGGGVLKEKTSAGGGVSGLREMFEAKARADAEKAAR